MIEKFLDDLFRNFPNNKKGTTKIEEEIQEDGLIKVTETFKSDDGKFSSLKISYKVSTEIDYDKQLKEALEKEDYLLAAEIKKKREGK